MSNKKVKRLHDTLYLKENRYKRPKESSKILYALIKKNLKKKKKQNFSILDVQLVNLFISLTLNLKILILQVWIFFQVY